VIRKGLVALGLLLVLALVLPPLWFAIFPDERPELPPPGRRVEIGDGTAVNVVERGAGPPVVLVHGLPGSAYDWRHLTDALAERNLRVLAYDRVGFGHSDPRPDDAYTVARNAEELLALLEALELEDATIVGWSYGGATAIRAAHRDPSRMHGLVLVGSAGPGLEVAESQGPSLADLLFSTPVLAWLRAVPPAGRAIQGVMSEMAFSEQTRPDWWDESLAANLGQRHALVTWRQEGRRFGEERPASDTAGLGLPVLVIHGDDDRLVPVAVAHALHEGAARGRLVVVEDGSHMLPITHPDRLADAIAEAVAEGVAGAPDYASPAGSSSSEASASHSR